jgi:hypothetical protein
VLKTVLVAGVKHTTAQWLWDFVVAVTNGASPTTPQRRTPNQREHARSRAAAELSKAGI